MIRLTGKVAIVTSAGRGNGRAVALKLAREGAVVVGNDRDETPTRDTVFASAVSPTPISVSGS